MKTTLLYVVKCQGFLKIGLAGNIKERLKYLQVGNPFPIEVLATFTLPKESAPKLEHSVHELLSKAGFHERGEWFSDRAEALLLEVLPNLVRKYNERGGLV